jgi:hypothetical protein
MFAPGIENLNGQPQRISLMKNINAFRISLSTKHLNFENTVWNGVY